MGVCAPAQTKLGCGDHGYAVCQFSQAGGTFVASLGSFYVQPQWSFITLPPQPAEPGENGVMYTFTNGDICWIAGRQQVRTVQVVFRCDPSQSDTMKIEEDQTTCTFTLTLKSPVACPGGGGGSAIISSNYTDTQTKSKWDLWPLHRDVGDFTGSLGSYNYSMNIGDLTTTQGTCRNEGHSICQYDYRGDFFAGLGGIRLKPAGQWSLIAPDPSVGIRQTYKNGEVCWIQGRQVPRTSIISYYCDPHGARAFTLTEDPTTCTYNFKFSVAEGCPSRA